MKEGYGSEWVTRNTGEGIAKLVVELMYEHLMPENYQLGKSWCYKNWGKKRFISYISLTPKLYVFCFAVLERQLVELRAYS